MPIPEFPDIMPPVTPSETPEDPGISTEMENGMVISRAKYTRSRLTFELVWGSNNDNPLKTEEKNILLNFYRNTVKGSSEKFRWICNAKNSSFYEEEFIVRFTGNPPKFTEITPGFWGTSLTIQEA